MLRNLPDGIFIKLSLVVAPIWGALAYRSMPTYDMMLNEAIAYLSVGMAAVFVAGIALQALYHRLLDRTERRRSTD